MALTSKQETFAQAVADGLNQSDAYRLAYSTGNMKSTTLWDNAYTLANHTQVALRILELKQAVLDESIASRAWNLDRLIQELAINVRLGRSLGQIAASSATLTTIGKALGLLVDKVDVNVRSALKPGLTLEELEGRIQRLDALEAGIVEGWAVVLEDDAEPT